MLKSLKRNNGWKIYGDPGAKLIVAGHSHTFSMLMAIQANPILSEVFGVVAESKIDALIGGEPREGSYWDQVKNLTNSRPICISWNGNQHNIHFLLETPERFQIYGQNEVSSQSPVVPISQIREFFKPTQVKLEETINKIQADSEIILLGTPAPKPKEFLDSILGNDSYFLALANSQGLSQGEIRVTSNSLRKILWQIYQEILISTSKNLGCKFIESPAESIGDDGMLKEIFWAPDITHANEQFGKLMLLKIANEFGFKLNV